MSPIPFACLTLSPPLTRLAAGLFLDDVSSIFTADSSLGGVGVRGRRSLREQPKLHQQFREPGRTLGRTLGAAVRAGKSPLVDRPGRPDDFAYQRRAGVHHGIGAECLRLRCRS